MRYSSRGCISAEQNSEEAELDPPLLCLKLEKAQISRHLTNASTILANAMLMGILLVGFNEDHFSDKQWDEIRRAAPHLDVRATRDKDEITALLGDTEVAAGSFPRDLLAKAPNLRWFQQWSAGADWLIKYPGAAEHPFTLTNVSGIHAVPISEHILAFMLAFARGLPGAMRDQAQRRWRNADERSVLELAGKTVLLVGVGAIGERTAKLAAALGMRVWGVRRAPSREVAHVARMADRGELHALLPDADFVVLTVPLTEETRHMMSADEFRAMKDSGYLINIGRGGTVNEADLIRALEEGQIAGAGLDVFEEEPLPEDSPLWAMENVIVTAHYSGDTPHYDARALEIFLENLRRYGRGESLTRVVDKGRGY